MTSRAMVVVGGGSSSRFGTDKLMVEVAGRPLLSHTIEAVISHVDVSVVVCRPEMVETFSRLHPEVLVVEGGPTRTQSEIAGLAAIDEDVSLVGIHDAARPVVDAATIDRLFTAAESDGGAVPLLGYDRLILHRETGRPIKGIHGAQTPQVFRASELFAAYQLAASEGFEGHDTVEVMERFSEVRIVAVDGSASNIKVTFPGDVDRLSDLLTDPSRI
jgi:2-C-methyl-D-erythritol 4-phosphate cytidylyltransferase